MGEMLLNGRLYGANGVMELTQSQYDALPVSKLTDGVLYCIKDSGSVEGEQFAPVIYSLEEREVGVWTDGKPLYQKTFEYQITSTINSGDTVLYSFPNVKVKNIDAVAIKNNTGRVYPLTYSTTSWITDILYGDNGDIIVSVFGTAWTNDYKFVITLQYTKTTDVPGSGTWGTDGVPMVHYDGNEKIIGTWFGETLYEKTIPFDNTGQSSLNIDVSSLNIGICPYVMPLLNSSAANTMTYYQSSSDYINAYYYKSSQEVVIRGGNPYGQGAGFVTIRYTKSS